MAGWPNIWGRRCRPHQPFFFSENWAKFIRCADGFNSNCARGQSVEECVVVFVAFSVAHFVFSIANGKWKIENGYTFSIFHLRWWKMKLGVHFSFFIVNGKWKMCVHFPFLPRCMECRRGLAMRILSVRPSVTRVNCDKTVERFVQIYIPYERSFSLVFCEEWLLGGDPFYLKFWVNRPPLQRNRRCPNDIRP